MLRTIALASALGSTLLACARAPVATPSVAHMPEPPPIGVAYRLLRTGDGAGVLLSGRTDVDTSHGARVEAVAAHSAAGEELNLDARPSDDGTFLVDVRYEETSAEGAKLKWAPAVRLARGATMRAEVNGNGWGRVLELTLE